MDSWNNATQLYHTACSKVVLDTLENLIAPGERARLSPYVEAAQIKMLFGQVVDPKNRSRSISGIVNQHQSRILELAEVWAEFCKTGKHFSAQIYSEKDFLSAYLIYYFSTNVAKLQVTLLNLLRTGELQNPAWRVMDIGVGAGTTIVAVADFLLAWKTVCDLYQAPFPVQQVQFAGLDLNPTALDFAAQTVQTYASLISQMSETAQSEFAPMLVASLEAANWLEFDIEHSENIPQMMQPNVLVASNVLSELSQTGYPRMARLLESLPEGCTALVLEPGDASRAKALMKWRSDFVSRDHFSRQGPCASMGNNPVSCSDCWNARRQSFHPSSLYACFRKVAQDILPDKRGFDVYENNLLSWSTVWMVRGAASSQSISVREIRPGEAWPEEIALQYIGRYTGKTQAGYEGPVGYAPDEFRSTQDKGWKEFIKFCPGDFATKGLTLVREPGIQFPRIQYGDQVKITHGRLSQLDNGVLEIKMDSYSQVVPLSEPLTHEESFLPAYSPKARRAIDEIGFRLFGFPGMRPFQHRILERVLTGHSILGIAATGSGKSECFILPAILLPGLTVVVSPLKSLMMDQYDQRICQRYGLHHLVTYINGDIDFNERQARLLRMELGYYKLVYFTPEQLERGYVLDSLRRADERIGVRYLAMDEAHCISQWGHDFRPSYLNLSRRFSSYNIHPTRIALTATASPFVRQDICEELGLNAAMLEDGGDVFVESSNRPELNLIVRVKSHSEDKISDIVDELRQFLRNNQNDQVPGAAIVFMPHTGGSPENRGQAARSPNVGRMSAGVTSFASYLERVLNQRVSIYHGKMEADSEIGVTSGAHPGIFGDMVGRSRRDEQQRFISNQTQIMVATKGFGMGIDKDNIRLIIHRSPPGNLEAYAQEAGRAGRDGAPADVILHYSPDSAEAETEYGAKKRVQSDFEIQEYFLKDKYIRRIDVVVMNAFLRTLSPGTKGAFYFTNDQAIEFFNRCIWEPREAGLDQPYQWPKFSRREPSGRESAEHTEILERGHLYKEKTDYLNRILQTLYRIRPNFEGKPRLAFLENVQETDALILNGRVLDRKAILESNAYFGEILRSNGITHGQFAALIQKGSVIDLSERLGVGIRETNDLLRDIKFFEGRSVNGKWMPVLLDFQTITAPKLGPAAGKIGLQEWREYAGARRRAKTNEAYQRAKQNGRSVKEWYDYSLKRTRKEPFPILDDWFSWKEMYPSKGWEVNPGAAFSNQVAFEQYLNDFMASHDQREANDWASFRRLLSDYVGVNEDGSLRHNRSQTDCLRAVLLGYLETYEVVDGDNCYSCSRCVPDENFDRYDLETRLKAVVRMPPAAIEAFDLLKEMVDEYPSRKQAQALFSAIEESEQLGRSLRGYFSGWSARLLDQNANHKAALWLRFEAMARHITQFQAPEFWPYARQILKELPKDYYQDFEAILNQLENSQLESEEGYQVRAKLYRNWEKPAEEANNLRKLLKIQLLPDNKTQADEKYGVAIRLAELHQENSPIADEREYEKFICLAARLATQWDMILAEYRRVTPSWSWERVLMEMDEIDSYDHAENLRSALYYTWIEADISVRKDRAVEWLQEKPERILKWPEPLRNQMLPLIPKKEIMKSQPLVVFLLNQTDNLELITEIGLAAFREGFWFEEKELKKIANSFESHFHFSPDTLSDHLPDEELRLKMIEALMPVILVRDLKKILHWITFF
jgi:ATP-dependent DNA helicase RecQ